VPAADGAVVGAAVVSAGAVEIAGALVEAIAVVSGGAGAVVAESDARPPPVHDAAPRTMASRTIVGRIIDFSGFGLGAMRATYSPIGSASPLGERP